MFISSSIGDAIAGSMWTNILPGLLRANLPDEPQSVIDAVSL